MTILDLKLEQLDVKTFLLRNYVQEDFFSQIRFQGAQEGGQGL